MMSTKAHIVIVSILLLCSIACGASAANVTDDRHFFEEPTAIPFETWLFVAAAGLVFLVLAAMCGVVATGGLTIIFGIISTLLLSAAAFATPVTGFYSYVVNSSTNATSQATPVVWGAFQPWMMWLMWGLASVAFLIFVLGILLLFKEQKAAEDMYWI